MINKHITITSWRHFDQFVNVNKRSIFLLELYKIITLRIFGYFLKNILEDLTNKVIFQQFSKHFWQTAYKEGAAFERKQSNQIYLRNHFIGINDRKFFVHELSLEKVEQLMLAKSQFLQPNSMGNNRTFFMFRDRSLSQVRDLFCL